MYCPTSFFSNQIKIDQFEKEICRAKHEYMNIHPPPPNQRSSDGPDASRILQSCPYKLSATNVNTMSQSFF